MSQTYRSGVHCAKLSRSHRTRTAEGATMARVLIIDEDEDFGDITKRSLESAGHEAVFRASEHTVDTLRRSNFDLVLLEVSESGSDGVDMVKRIRGAADAKVLFYSTMDMDA